MSNFEAFMRTLRSSKQYVMDCDGHLVITDYNSGEEFRLNLKVISEELFEEMIIQDDEYEELW